MIIRKIFAILSRSPTPIIHDSKRAPIASVAEPRTSLPDKVPAQITIDTIIIRKTIINLIFPAFNGKKILL